jgi:hypothetical protein
MQLLRPGKYAFSSTRNNNFSNRDQKLLICVPGTDPVTNTVITCDAAVGSGMLQDTNPASSSTAQRVQTSTEFVSSQCFNTYGANDAQMNCLAGVLELLREPTRQTFGQDNDNYGAPHAVVPSEEPLFD